MKASIYTNDISKYLKCDAMVDFDHPSVSELADQLYGESENETDFIRRAYEYVRDRISHSADAGAESVTCSASEVLNAGHGICFAKSHLLAAVLRSKSVPAGFCYQKLILDDETAPVLIYHGLNGVYLRNMRSGYALMREEISPEWMHSSPSIPSSWHFRYALKKGKSTISLYIRIRLQR